MGCLWEFHWLLGDCNRIFCNVLTFLQCLFFLVDWNPCSWAVQDCLGRQEAGHHLHRNRWIEGQHLNPSPSKCLPDWTTNQPTDRSTNLLIPQCRLRCQRHPYFFFSLSANHSFSWIFLQPMRGLLAFSGAFLEPIAGRSLIWFQWAPSIDFANKQDAHLICTFQWMQCEINVRSSQYEEAGLYHAFSAVLTTRPIRLCSLVPSANH